MEYTIDFDPDRPALTLTSSGEADLATILRAQDELFADPRFRPGVAMLFDHSRLDTKRLSAADVRRIGEAYKAFLERIGESRVAVVVGGPAGFGLMRMAEAHAGAPAPNVGVFYSRSDADNWLLEPVRP